MLKQIKIENFRCFKSFELQQLGRVNLLVGKNNSGKTSILEAIKILSSENILGSLKTLLENRGEYTWNDMTDRRLVSTTKKEYILCHLFFQHQIYLNNSFIISDSHKTIIFIIREHQATNNEDNFVEKSNVVQIRIIENQNSSESILYKLTDNFTLVDRFIGSKNIRDTSSNTQFITSSSLNLESTIELFNKIVLTPEEEFLYQALKILEPKIERIAPIIMDRRYYSAKDISRNGFVVKLTDSQQRIPIGSMGDGVWRMLGLSLALVAAKDGVLLVDEIDTGLHYTALEDMWKLIWETAKKLNVQVFATTHSRDCYEALEVLANRDDVGEEDISIQRIEKDATKSVAYNKEEIAVAAEREIEVR